MLSGVGLGSDIFRQLIQNYKLYTKAVPPHTHILYLQIWIEMGLAGFVTFMWYIYRTIKNSVIGIYNSSLTLKPYLPQGRQLCADFGDVAGGVQLVLSKSDGYVLGAFGDNCRSDIFG